MSLLMIHEAYMPVYSWSWFFLRARGLTEVFHEDLADLKIPFILHCATIFENYALSPYLSWSTWLKCCANPEFLRCFAKKSFLCVHTPLRAFHLCRSRSTTLVTKTWRKTSTQRKTSLLFSRDSLTGWQQLECNFKWRSMARFNQLTKKSAKVMPCTGTKWNNQIFTTQRFLLSHTTF